MNFDHIICKHFLKVGKFFENNFLRWFCKLYKCFGLVLAYFDKIMTGLRLTNVYDFCAFALLYICCPAITLPSVCKGVPEIL
jgi:hypothetical protein